MDWIIVILAGAFIGWIASMVMGTNAQMGAIANIVVGLVGAVIGRFVASLLHLGKPRHQLLDSGHSVWRFGRLHPDRYSEIGHGRQKDRRLIAHTIPKSRARKSAAFSRLPATNAIGNERNRFARGAPNH